MNYNTGIDRNIYTLFYYRKDMENMRELMLTSNKEVRVASVELVEIINEFRRLESETIGKDFKELLHKNLLSKIKTEVETLEKLGITNEGNISLVSYKDNKGEERPCYSFNRDGMLQMLNSESALVRYKTIEYIDKLEEENKKLKDEMGELLKEIYNGGQGAVLASKRLTEIEIGKATKELTDKIEQDKPLVDFADSVAESSDSIDMGTFAKLIKDEEVFDKGRNKLFEWLRENGYISKKKVKSQLTKEHYQKYVDQGLFEIKEIVIKTPYGDKIKTKTLVTGKGQIYFVEKLRKTIDK